MTGYLYIIGTIYGQLVLKWRICQKILVFLFKLLFDPFIFSGFAAAFIASFFWMAAMTKFDLSHVYPIIVGGLALATSVFAIVFLKEALTIYKILGIFLVFTL